MLLMGKLDGAAVYEDGSVDGIIKAPTVHMPVKVEKACRDVLGRVVKGLARNPSVQATTLMVYIHSLMDKYLPASVHGSTAVKKAAAAIVWTSNGETKTTAGE